MTDSIRLARHQAAKGDTQAAARLKTLEINGTKLYRDKAGRVCVAGELAAGDPGTPIVKTRLNHLASSPPIVVSAASQSTVATLTQADVDRAVAARISRERASAVAAERKRIADVFASDASKGRERICATLLASPKGFSAASIIAELPGLGTDRGGTGTNVLSRCAMVRGSNDPAKMAAASAVWDQVLDGNSPSASVDAWDRVYAEMGGRALS